MAKRYGCTACGTEYSLQIFTCPRCTGTEIVEVGLTPVPLSVAAERNAAAAVEVREPLTAGRGPRAKAARVE